MRVRSGVGNGGIVLAPLELVSESYPSAGIWMSAQGKGNWTAQLEDFSWENPGHKSSQEIIYFNTVVYQVTTI